jgi:ribosomal protein S18 acetylase RimI-like enzyme
MIIYKLVKNLTEKENKECNILINENFEKNRFTDYKYVIIYKIKNNIIGFIGIYENLLNQICTNIEYRRKGIGKEMIETAKKMLKGDIYLYIDKKKENTEYLLNYYEKNGFKIIIENEIEYKMINKKNIK